MRNFIKAAFALFCTSCFTTGFAQVCTGSLGDPVVNITFGAGQNPGAPVRAATTTYVFDTTSCPNDGRYTVVNSTAKCFTESWHTVPEDHTPNDVNGYMMLVNATFLPGDFYLDTVRNLCPNTTYEFAAWIANILQPNSCSGSGFRPNLVFNIESVTGTIIGTYSTGDIPTAATAVWKQYGLFFTTPANTTAVVLRLKNTAVGGCGNDVAIDDITFRPCGPNITSSFVGLTQSAIDLCVGATRSIPLRSVIGPGFTSPSYFWQLSKNNGVSWTDIPGATTLNYQFNETQVGVYMYRLVVGEGTNINIPRCRIASNPIRITIHALPAIAAAVTNPVCLGLVFNLNASGGATYSWTGPAGFTSTQANPALVATAARAGIYNLRGVDQFGCVNTATTNVVTNPTPVATITATQNICEGDSVRLVAGGGTTYAWTPAAGLSGTSVANPFAKPADSTTYRVIVSNASNCKDTATVRVNVLKRPTANAGPDKTIFSGRPVVLEGSAPSTPGVRYFWSPATFLNDSLLLQPTATPTRNITYTLNAVSVGGCGTASDAMNVTVTTKVHIPSAFSPNGDGLNDTWRVEALSFFPNARTAVYNRVGNLLFEATGFSRQWDGTYKGKPQPVGAYTYMIDLKDGSPVLKGSVTIYK